MPWNDLTKQSLVRAKPGHFRITVEYGCGHKAIVSVPDTMTTPDVEKFREENSWSACPDKECQRNFSEDGRRFEAYPFEHKSIQGYVVKKSVVEWLKMAQINVDIWQPMPALELSHLIYERRGRLQNDDHRFLRQYQKYDGMIDMDDQKWVEMLEMLIKYQIIMVVDDSTMPQSLQVKWSPFFSKYVLVKKELFAQGHTDEWVKHKLGIGYVWTGPDALNPTKLFFLQV